MSKAVMTVLTQVHFVQMYSFLLVKFLRVKLLDFKDRHM